MTMIETSISILIVPSILAVKSHQLLSNDNYVVKRENLLYVIVAYSTILSTTFNLVLTIANRYTRSRARRTLTLAIILTLTTVASIVITHIIRLNSQDFSLPLNIQNNYSSPISEPFKFHLNADIIPSLIPVSQALLFHVIINDLINKAKRTFHLGEATIIGQLISAVYVTWALSIYTRITGAGPYKLELPTDVALNLGVVLISVTFLPCHALVRDRKATKVRYSILLIATALAYTFTSKIISEVSTLDPLTWLIDYVFSSHQRISLFCVWLPTVVGCMSFSSTWSKLVGKTNSLARKVFHLAICFVFITGYNQDVGFLKFAGGCSLILLALLEIIRAWQLKPFGKNLEEICKSLRGRWDNKFMTLSHIYLLVGVMLPLWLLPGEPIGNKLILSSGFLAVGVGDTTAAIVGTFLGRTKLKGGKSLEGYVGFVGAVTLAKFAWVGFIDFRSEYTFIMATLLTGLVELVTKDCDNLILPLVMVLLLETL